MIQTALNIYGRCYIVVSEEREGRVCVSIWKTDDKYEIIKEIDRGFINKNENKFHQELRNRAIKKDQFIENFSSILED